MKTEIKELKKSDKTELLDLFTEAFEGEPTWISAFSRKPGATRDVMKAFLDFFGSAKNSWLYGIREAGRFVCTSVPKTLQPSLSYLRC